MRPPLKQGTEGCQKSKVVDQDQDEVGGTRNANGVGTLPEHHDSTKARRSMKSILLLLCMSTMAALCCSCRTLLVACEDPTTGNIQFVEGRGARGPNCVPIAPERPPQILTYECKPGDDFCTSKTPAETAQLMNDWREGKVGKGCAFICFKEPPVCGVKKSACS